MISSIGSTGMSSMGLRLLAVPRAGLRLSAVKRAAACSAASTRAASSETAHKNNTSFSHGITYTSYEVNTFQMKFNTTGVRVLVDPWFVGDLTFLEQNWLYRGKKRVIGHSIKVDMEQVASETDVLVLTQALDDHTHMPTLRQFPKHVLVVANPQAAERIKPLGFQNVQVIDHGQTLELAGGKLRVTATVGALVGPPWSKRQNGLVFREVPPPQAGNVNGKEPFQGASVYFEPHADFDEGSVRRAGKVDVVISPVLTALLGVGGTGFPLVMGDINLVKLLKILQPKVLVPLLNNEIDHEGPLGAVIQDRGSYDELRARLAAEGLGDIRVEWPAPAGESLAIAL